LLLDIIVFLLLLVSTQPLPKKESEITYRLLVKIFENFRKIEKYRNQNYLYYNSLNMFIYLYVLFMYCYMRTKKIKNQKTIMFFVMKKRRHK